MIIVTTDEIRSFLSGRNKFMAFMDRLSSTRPYLTGKRNPGWHSEERMAKAEAKRQKRLERNKARYVLQEQESYVRAIQYRAVVEQIGCGQHNHVSFEEKPSAPLILEQFELDGKPKAIIECPECNSHLEVFVNSMAGSGKKCSCGVKIKKVKGEDSYYVE